MKYITLSRGLKTVVDDEDYEYLSKFKWYADKVYNGAGFVVRRDERINGKKKSYLMHRVIMGNPDGLEIDHLDHNGLNNCKCNLRRCTHSQNLMNQSQQQLKSSQYKGVSWSKVCCKWHAYIKCKGKRYHLGYFTKQSDAAKAYNAAAKVLFGEFAYVNVV